jgi:hypothetical protein
MKKNNILLLTLLVFLVPSVIMFAPEKLENPILQVADEAGFFHNALPDINEVGQELVAFRTGKSTWNGIILSIDVITEQKTNRISIYLKDPALLYGATYLVISHKHQHVQKYLTAEQKKLYLESIKKEQREDFFTGSYAVHPLSQEKIPVYISDYNNDTFETRTGHAHLAIPAHSYNDFYFAQKYNLPINLVVQPTEKQIDRGVRKADVSYRGVLRNPYIIRYEDCLVNTDPKNPKKQLTGTEAAKKITHQLIRAGRAKKHSELICYSYDHKKEPFYNLLKIEAFLKKNKHSLSPAVYKQKKALLDELLTFAHADFLSLVESFLVKIQGARPLMIPLIAESCAKRKKDDCYLLRYSNMDGNESERVRFKKDIVTFADLASFSTDLIHFLSDLAYSCPCAQAYLKSLNNEQ